jgi:hypothetical protein
VNHSARRVACGEGKGVRVLAPVGLIDFDTVKLNLSLTYKIGQRLVVPTSLGEVTEAMRD